MYKGAAKRIENLLLIERSVVVANVCVMQQDKLNKKRSRKQFQNRLGKS